MIKYNNFMILYRCNKKGLIIALYLYRPARSERIPTGKPRPEKVRAAPMGKRKKT